MKKLLLLALLAAAGFYFLVRPPDELPKLEELAADLKEASQSVSAPGPLRLAVDAPRSFLTQAGVVQWTNNMRQQNGLAALQINAKLNNAALAKVSDMFAKQYFAHVAPDGRDASDLALESGYKYITVGENLALGNYENDEALLEAWMDSPGHRANILSEGYLEIGVAVKRGVFEGKQTWLAVQIFGKPLSACPSPDPKIKQQAVANEGLMAQLKTALDAKREAIESYKGRKDEDYNKLVQEYNELVSEYNNLIEQTKSLIGQYNQQVEAFNECAAN